VQSDGTIAWLADQSEELPGVNLGGTTTPAVATVSSLRASVLIGSAAPTAITFGLAAGMVTLPAAKPSVPAATTATMPFVQACSTANDSGSSAADCTESVPKDGLRTRMLSSGSLRFATTQSIAAITDAVIAEISRELTARLAQPAETPRTDR
jgi:hypothetical protein